MLYPEMKAKKKKKSNTNKFSRFIFIKLYPELMMTRDSSI